MTADTERPASASAGTAQAGIRPSTASAASGALRGEEAFLIEQHHDGTVSFTITAFSRHATLLAKAAGPAGRAVQRYLTARYLQALAS